MSRPATHLATSNVLELTFDILFVFTITQLAKTLARDHSWTGFAQTVVLVVLMWWTFGSYASLTRSERTRTGRVLLVAGIVANFTLALSIPYALTTDRLVFAVAYTVVVAVHTALYLLECDNLSRAQKFQTGLVNGASPAVVLVGALAGGLPVVVWWALAAVVELALPVAAQWFSPHPATHVPALSARPDRFVQRHGVLLLILLGEAVLTIGVGLGTAFRDLDTEQVLVAVTAVGLAGTLYYAYFGERDDDAAYRALERTPPHRREGVAMLSFGYAFALMLLGVDFAVAGVHDVLEDPGAVPALTFGGYLAGGVGAYWVGLGFFRLAIGRPFARPRIGFGFALGVFAFLGRVSGLNELLALLALSLLMLAAESFGARRRKQRETVVAAERDRP